MCDELFGLVPGELFPIHTHDGGGARVWPVAEGIWEECGRPTSILVAAGVLTLGGRRPLPESVPRPEQCKYKVDGPCAENSAPSCFIFALIYYINIFFSNVQVMAACVHTSCSCVAHC